MSTTDRSDYISGLRELADRLDANPDCPLPYTGASEHSPLDWILDNREDIAAVARLLGNVNKERDHQGSLMLTGALEGLRVRVLTFGDVCERVEVGTETVTTRRPGCPECASDLSDDGEMVTCSVGGAEHFSAEALPWVEESKVLPVYETRCPESLLRPEAASIEDRVLCGARVSDGYGLIPDGYCLLDRGHDEGCANVRTVVEA